MNLLIVEANKTFRDFLRLWVAEQAAEDIPDVFEAGTLVDALRMVSENRADAVVCGEAFPPDWGDRMGDPLEWRA
jgi:hypothetical protein